MLCLVAFFGLPGQDAGRLVALKAGVLIERGVKGISNRGLIGGLRVMGCTCHRRTEIDYFAGVLVDQQNVLVRMGLLLAAIILLLQRLIGGALAAAFGAIKGEIGCTLQHQLAVGDTAGVALRGPA